MMKLSVSQRIVARKMVVKWYGFQIRYYGKQRKQNTDKNWLYLSCVLLNTS